MSDKNRGVFVFLDESFPKVDRKKWRQFLESLPAETRRMYHFYIFQFPNVLRNIYCSDFQVTLFIRKMILEKIKPVYGDRNLYFFATLDNDFVADAQEDRGDLIKKRKRKIKRLDIKLDAEASNNKIIFKTGKDSEITILVSRLVRKNSEDASAIINKFFNKIKLHI